LVHELLVVGGGIHGAAVARDAALRGLRVLLVERGDLASGTSSRSSKLIHGGIRYLETLQIRLVREALREREILLRTAPPGLVRPVRFLLPEYRGEGRSGPWVALGLWLYGALAGRTRLAQHEHMSAREALELEPDLSPRGLRGAFLFWDAQMDDAALCVAVALAAAEAGAELRTHTAVASLRLEAGRWRARLRDEITGEERTAEARAVVNAAGPWADEVRALAGHRRDAKLRRSRGTHVVLPTVTRGRALLLTARSDRRVLFVLPWGSHSLVGTTDIDDASPPGDIAPTLDEVRYLLDEAARALPGIGPKTRPLRVFAGVRSLLSSGAASPSANPREHRIIMEGTLVSLIGGKYTTHRSLAERVVDRVVRALGKRARPCATATTPLPDRREAAIVALRSRHPDRVDAGNGLSVSEAEAVHAVREERARTLDDVLLRRTQLWLDAPALRRAAPRVAGWIGGELGWGDTFREMELLRLSAELDREEAVIARALAQGGGR
jgi:glycerol-3-phosphate dehydrogenase